MEQRCIDMLQKHILQGREKLKQSCMVQCYIRQKKTCSKMNTIEAGNDTTNCFCMSCLTTVATLSL